MIKCTYMVTVNSKIAIANIEEDALVAWCYANGFDWLFDEGPFERAELLAFNDMLKCEGYDVVIWANN